MRNALIVALVLLLAGCGGSGKHSDSRSRGGAIYTPTAHGPLRTACLASDRKARSESLCGCIQAVANQTLTSADQKRAVSFYRDPHLAQEVRQSSRASDKRFWASYSDYSKRAGQVCG